MSINIFTQQDTSMFGLQRLTIDALIVVVCLFAASPARGETETIVLSQNPLPDEAGVFGTIGSYSLNVNGQVAFRAARQINGEHGDGLYLYDKEGLINLVRSNVVVPGANGVFHEFYKPNLNAAGQVLFGATLENTSGGMADDSGVYLHNGTNLITIVRENAVVPEGNGRFDDPVGHYTGPSFALNSSGQVSFVTQLRNTSDGGFDNSGVYLHDGSTLANLVRENALVPEGGNRFAEFFGRIQLNSSSQVAFFSSLRNPTGGSLSGEDYGVYLSKGGSLINIARTNNIPPDGNGRYSGVGSPILNDSGHVSFKAGLQDTSGGTNDNEGIYLFDGAAVVGLARENAPVPEGNGQFSFFSPGIPLLNEAGHVSFNAVLRNTSGSDDDNSGVYLHNGTTLLNLAREGQTTPDGRHRFAVDNPGAIPFVRTWLNSSGQVAFFSSLQETVSGANAGFGIYVTDGVETVKVVQTGDMIAGDTVTSILGGLSVDGYTTSGGAPAPFNDLGQYAYKAAYSGGAEGLFLFTPELDWRNVASGQWDTPQNWTLGLKPGLPHDISIQPATDLTVAGPSAATVVKSLAIGGGTGIAALELQSTGHITSTNGIEIHPTGQLTGDGTLVGDVVNSGLVSPGTSPGAIRLDGNYHQSTVGRLLIELASPTSFDNLQISGSVELGGMLDVSLLGFTPQVGSIFEIMTALGGVAGRFANTQLPSLPDALRFDVRYDLNSVTLAVVSVPEPSTFILAALSFISMLIRRGITPRPAGGRDCSSAG